MFSTDHTKNLYLGTKKTLGRAQNPKKILMMNLDSLLIDYIIENPSLGFEETRGTKP